jgi:hypothetical protein
LQRETAHWKVIDDQVIDNVHHFADHLLASTDDFKITVSTDYAYVYTNSLKIIAEIQNLPYVKFSSCTEVNINRPKDTVKLKNSSNRYRSYFKFLKITDKEKENLVNFFKIQKNNIRVSPALSEWVKAPKYNRIQEYYFIDYDDSMWLTMLSLVRPGIVRKTKEIITAK